MVKNIIESLGKLLIEENKEAGIRSLRDYVHSNKDVSSLDEKIQDILIELVYDLDFYEPAPNKRIEDGSLFDDERLIEYTTKAIEKLKELEKSE
jgi:hypothetical protein